MRVMGAMLIDGPKAVGKTQTATQIAKTVLRLDVDPVARAALETMPEQLFNYPTPILFDEWQETADLWNLVRRAVDDHHDKGLYLLTGSATPRDDARIHSGSGRIGRLRMRPMSLFESGHSDGSVSLSALLDGGPVTGSTNTLTVPQLLERIVVGGWPEITDWDVTDAREWLTDYLRNLVEVDVPRLGPRRNPENITRLLASLARAVGTPVKRSELEVEVGGSAGPIASETLNHYLDALDRLMVLEPLPAWRPHMRSRTRLRTTPVHHFVDPSIGTAALGVGPDDLVADLNAAGLHFESMVLRDLRVYAQPLGAKLSSWRDTRVNKEVDAVLELPNGTWAAFEFKLGEGATNAAADSLNYFASKVDTTKHGEPAALVVVNGGRFAMRRDDGVTVVPISNLGP
jgi:predicted AAA+ superfamily ATPase